MRLIFFEIFSGLLSTLGLILELYLNKTLQKWKSTCLLHYFNQLIESYQKNLILVKKGVSGVPYLKNST